MSSLAGLKKNFPFLRKSTDFDRFWLPRITFKVDFLNVQANIEKSSVIFLGDVERNCVKI